MLASMAVWVRFDPCKPFVRCFATARCPMFPEGCQGKTKRRRFGYNVATVLAEREAVPPELRNMDDRRTRHSPKGKFTAQALLHVERSNTWDGPLSPWSDEAALQRCFLGYPLDAYVVKVTHVFHLPDSRPLFTRISTKGEEVALTLRSDSLVFQPVASKPAGPETWTQLEALLQRAAPLVIEAAGGLQLSSPRAAQGHGHSNCFGRGRSTRAELAVFCSRCLASHLQSCCRTAESAVVVEASSCCSSSRQQF